MLKRLFALACLPALVGGCGQASEDAFNREFDEKFTSSCEAAATGGAIPAELATQACGCALAKINEQYSTTEKLTLTDEQVQPIAAECFEKVAPTNG